MNLGTAQIIRADSRNLPLPDNSVDLIVTSPPYFALRSYQDGGQHYEGQIGDEPTPAEFVDSLIEVTRECMRVLKPSGSLWVNLGDKYAQDQERSRNGNGNRVAIDNFVSGPVMRGPTVTLGRKINGTPRKSLIGIPWRYALRCIDDLGLILRAEVIWSKPNGLPESVTDRVRRSHETWFHFVKQPRYFSGVDEIREAYNPVSVARAGRASNTPIDAPGQTPQRRGETPPNPLGALPGSVRTVPTEPLRVPDHLGVDHFAAFPTAWPKWIIQGWAPTKGVCVACGEGRRPTSATERTHNRKGRQVNVLDRPERGHDTQGLGWESVTTITGYACACDRCLDMTASPNGAVRCWLPMGHDGLHAVDFNNPGTPPTTRPAVILDPFGGTGTTALVAKALGCHGISVDMSADYCRLAEWRTNDPGQLAKVLSVDKPPEVDPAQADLFDLLGGDAA